MAWKCDYCNTPQPQGTPLTLTTPDDSWREVKYTNINPETGLNEAIAIGREAIAEFKVCRSCLGLPPAAPVVTESLRTYLRMAMGYHEHAKGCPGHKTVKHKDRETGEEVKEQIPCRVCELIIRDFKSFPLGVLSKALEDPKPKDLKVPLAILVRDVVLDKTAEGNAFYSVRASKDATVALQALKGFEDRNQDFFRKGGRS